MIASTRRVRRYTPNSRAIDVHGEHGDEQNKKENDERQPPLQSTKL